MTPRLAVKGLSKRFGGVEALRAVDLLVAPGEALAITGANGAGKSTLLACLAGRLTPTAGEVRLDGGVVNGLPPHLVARLGLGWTFQTPCLMFGASALDNVALGRHRDRRASFGAAVLGLGSARAADAATRAAASAYLEQVGLRDKASCIVAELSYGEQKRLDLARALAGEPRALLLDEPCAGASPRERALIIDLLAALRREGTSLVLVEHHRDVVEALADRTLHLTAGLEGPERAASPLPSVSDRAEARLTVEGLRLRARSGATILEGATFALAAGEIVCVSGGNASGKTTLLGALAGLRANAAGRIELGGTAIEGWPTHRRVEAGLILVDRSRTLFEDLTVKDNLRAQALSGPADDVSGRLQRVQANLPWLTGRLGHHVRTLSGGEQQQLALARAWMRPPRVLLVDEPTLGLAPAAAAQIRALVAEVAAGGAAVLITEQAPTPHAHRTLALEAGRLTPVSATMGSVP